MAEHDLPPESARIRSDRGATGAHSGAQMRSPERLTIDVTVARDFLDAGRAGHPSAMQLFELFRAGKVEIAAAPQGYRLDANGRLAEQLRELTKAEGVDEAHQLAYTSEVTYTSETLVTGAFVPGVSEAWNRITANWRSHEWKPPGVADRFHVETHILDGRDVFLTEDQALLVMCRRLREEDGFPVTAMRVAEYLDGHRDRG
jgi:hypothetical protein